ncbi:MAG: YihY/virulence factor BrkB family protein [Clostridia bacterium]|nr:YihY/virulence factor BrkB family protein [Clostridia bacterium]
MTSVLEIIKDVYNIYLNRLVPRASAALSYYLTMTIFPLIICLYALFGQNYQVAMNVFNYLEQFLTPSADELIKSFLMHVAGTSGRTVLIAAITMLVVSASAAVRVLQGTINEMQGGHRFRAMTDFLVSFALAVALLLAVYLSMVVLLTGRRFLDWLQQSFSINVTDAWWISARFMLLGGVAFLLFWGIFGFTRPRNDKYLVLPGALLATAGVVLMSTLFSRLIASSARYSLVYGSLASLILLMLWLYLICQAIFVGAALNIALRDRKARRKSQKTTA